MVAGMRIFSGVVFAALAGVAGGGVAGATPTAGPTCTHSRPSTFLVSPKQTAPGGTTRLLLWCDEPSPRGFEGSFGPTGLVIYSESGLARRHFEHGYPAPAGTPLLPLYDIVGPDEIRVTLPASTASGAYVVLVDNGVRDVRAQNLLHVS